MKNNTSNKITLNVEGMTCNNCAAGIKKHLEKNNLNNVNVNFSLGEVSFTLQKNNSLNYVISLIEKIGYKVKNKQEKKKKKCKC